MNYSIFIDETGDFLKKGKSSNSTNYIGGFFVKSNLEKEIELKVQNICSSVVKEVNKNSGKEYSLKIPEELHFAPLHWYQQNNNKNINFPKKYAPFLYEKIFEYLKDKVEFIFRSTGRPEVQPSAQAVYFEILRSVIIQILDSFPIKREDDFFITIASRRSKNVLDSYYYENIQQYEENLKNWLENDIKNAYKFKKNNVFIKFESTHSNIFLALADSFCGAFGPNKKKYIKGFQKEKKFKFHDAFEHFPKNIIGKLKWFFEKNYFAQALLEAFQYLNSNPENQSIKSLVQSKASGLSDENLDAFYIELEKCLEENLVTDPRRYLNLESMEKLINTVRIYIDHPKLNLLLRKYEIIILNHKGSTNIEKVREYLAFLDKYGALSFGSAYLTANERLETLLHSVHMATFNQFKFEEVEDCLTDELKKYKNLIEKNTYEQHTDEALARLEGTIGQMYGFLCDYPDYKNFFDDAENHLKKDIELCKKGSRYYKQGLGYLTTLYFKKKEKEKALENFLEESNYKNEEEVFNLCSKEENDPFVKLHQIYICALEKQDGGEIKNFDKLVERLSKFSGIKYPDILIFKWTGVLAGLNNNYDTALNLFNMALSEKESEFAVDVIKLSVKILINLCHSKLGKRKAFDIQKELNELEEKCSGISDNLKRLGVEKYIDTNYSSWDFFEISSMLPFYYS